METNLKTNSKKREGKGKEKPLAFSQNFGSGL